MGRGAHPKTIPCSFSVASLLIPCSDMRRKQVQWLEIGSGCGFPRSRAQFEAPENAKFPVFFPVSRENASGAGFACDCVHRQPVLATPQRVARIGPGDVRSLGFPLICRRNNSEAGRARRGPAIRLPAPVRSAVSYRSATHPINSRKALNVIENPARVRTKGSLTGA
jgi:hypothetical protein